MPKIRIDMNTTPSNGRSLTFKSPADCSDITGLIVYYPAGETTSSKEFKFVDSHGVDVGKGTVSLFAENAFVKIILDTDNGLAFVQNADTNDYLEGKLEEKYSPDNKPSPADIGAAAASHGNHVPSVESANNARFLRNDNTWQTVTPANIGASATGHKHTKSEITDFPSSMPASDVPSWAKASSKPSYSWSEITSKPTTFTPSTHTHSASDINSGTLSSDRLPTVPVTKGGTGATTAAAARTNLGIKSETWTFTLEDGATVTKAVYVG